MSIDDAGQDHPSAVAPGPRSGEVWVRAGEGRFLATSRDWASGVLARAAEAVRSGTWPSTLTMFDVARALKQAVGNAGYPLGGDAGPYPEREEALEEFAQGWRSANLPHAPTGPDDIGTAPVPAELDFHPGYELREDGSPVPDRVRSVRGHWLWWRTEPGGVRWTDGLVVGSWPEVSARVGATYAAD